MKKNVCLALANKTVSSDVQVIYICIEPSLKLCKPVQADMAFLASVPVITNKQTQQGAVKKHDRQQRHVDQRVCIKASF